MVNNLDYTTTALVLESWEALKRSVCNYEEVAGCLLFRLLFEKCPQAKVLFGYPMDMDPSSHDLLHSRRFKLHAVYMIQMLDSALNLLGPDLELLTDILGELGRKHRHYGVKPTMFPYMGQALLQMLQTLLTGRVMNAPTVEAWKICYQELSQDMMAGASNSDAKQFTVRESL